MSIELLPCPFCGGEAEIERVGDHHRSTIYTCTECGASLETGEEWGHGRRWNERANLNTELLASMKAERDEADRRAGAAERELAKLKEWFS
jgi:Lar family restriction alleviation protein